MRNKIEYGREPQGLFLNPWREAGLSLVHAPEYTWREHPTATIEGFAASAHGSINRKIRSFLHVTRRQKKFDRAFVFNAIPALVENAGFRKSHLLSGPKTVLKGASATRAINGYRWENQAEETPPDATLDEFFDRCRAVNAGRSLPVGAVPPLDVPIAIECRNTFNYFHFITESLAQLCLFDGLTQGREIFFHYPNTDDKCGPFARAFVEALFPECAGRVHFERAPKEYRRVLTGYELIAAQPQAPKDAAFDQRIPRPVRARVGTAGTGFQTLLQMNAVSRTLLDLRTRALRAVAGKAFAHLPPRIFVVRRDARDRPVAGQDRLTEHLQLFGFEAVAFEDHPPLEQIALMARAEMVIAPHGAGMANMLFAGPGTHVIELGTLQTAQFRWADFWPLAHAAQCRYVSFFADFNTETPLSEPQFSRDGIVPVALSDAAVAQIMAYVVTALGYAPDLPRVTTLRQLAQQLLQADLPQRALAVLDGHGALVAGNADLCLLRADCHKALAEPKSELVAIDRAFKADPTRWQTLVRIIWCAHHCDRPQVIRWALSRLERDFPDRHDAFVSTHDWVRYVA